MSLAMGLAGGTANAVSFYGTNTLNIDLGSAVPSSVVCSHDTNTTGGTCFATTEPPPGIPGLIDFDNTTPGSLLTADYLENGFLMENTAGHYDIWGSGGTDDTPYLGLDSLSFGSSTVRFTGGLFGLISFESINLSGLGWWLQVNSSAGGNIILDTNGINSFAGPDWSNLTWLTISSNESIAGPGIDTITFDTAVPAPSAIYLFTSGLFGLIGLTKKRKIV